MEKAKFWFDCTSIPSGLRQGFEQAVDNAKEITPERFKKVVETDDLNNIAEQLGYYVGKAKNGGMRLYDDCYVRFYVSKLKDKRILILEQSSVEYVFKVNNN